MGSKGKEIQKEEKKPVSTKSLTGFLAWTKMTTVGVRGLLSFLFLMGGAL